MPASHTIDTITEGMSATRKKVISRADITAFGMASGDHNPVHFDEDYAKSTPFGGIIAHGMLSAGLVSAVLGEELPGHGTVYLRQSLVFRAPVRPGDELVATCTVTKVYPERRRVALDCVCRVGDMVVLDGEALVMAPEAAKDAGETAEHAAA